MLDRQPNNLLEIDELISNFLQEHQIGISTIHKIYYRNDSKLSLQSFIIELMDELRTGCVTFINNNYLLEELNSYLFYIVNAFAKKMSEPIKPKNKTEYLCPGCLFIGNETKIEYINSIFKCYHCDNELKKTTDPQKILLFSCFAKHNKQGYRCPDCSRVISHPINDALIVSCPYFDCCFAGKILELKRMHHPSTTSIPEKLILDATKNNGDTLHNVLVNNQISVTSQLEAKEDLENKVSLLKEIIETQYNSIPYNSTEFTAKHKMLCYQSFNNLLDRYPLEMVDYLLNSSRSGGFQHKVFQEYIRLLEASFPLIFKKNKKLYKINSLLDDNLSLFDGISSFDNIITDKGIIKNATNEFYIGGRKSKIVKAYYIGKLLNILDKKSKKSLIGQVTEYSFSLIKTNNIAPGTEVTVTHLRVPPHYQMGGMVYVNRIRKKIIDRAKQLII